MNITNNIIETAYFLGHNGLGDNITNIGSVNFLMKYYKTIYFLCKDKYYENVKALFQNQINDNKIIIVPFNTINENLECCKIINYATKNNKNCDIFISGFVHKSYLKSKINNPEIKNYQKNNNKYTIEFNHIKEFYNDIGLDLTIYYEYFNIQSNEITMNYYNNIKQYEIIFLHTLGSNKEINLSKIINKYINDEKKILICSNKNVYNINHNKYDLANQYVNLLVAYYIDIIKNSIEIYVIDSCFSCIIIPLKKTNRLAANIVEIYDRNNF
jgi:hypothetical protein